MSYAIYTDKKHENPEYSPDGNWARWNTWAKQHAPWTSVLTPRMAALYEAAPTPKARKIVNDGGTLSLREVIAILQSNVKIPENALRVLEFAAKEKVGVRITLSGMTGYSDTVEQYLEINSED